MHVLFCNYFSKYEIKLLFVVVVVIVAAAAVVGYGNLFCNDFVNKPHGNGVILN